MGDPLSHFPTNLFGRKYAVKEPNLESHRCAASGVMSYFYPFMVSVFRDKFRPHLEIAVLCSYCKVTDCLVELSPSWLANPQDFLNFQMLCPTCLYPCSEMNSAHIKSMLTGCKRLLAQALEDCSSPNQRQLYFMQYWPTLLYSVVDYLRGWFTSDFDFANATKLVLCIIQIDCEHTITYIVIFVNT